MAFLVVKIGFILLWWSCIAYGLLWRDSSGHTLSTARALVGQAPSQTQLLHEALLSGYPNPPDIPPSDAKVSLSVNFVKFIELDLLSSTLEFAAWLRLSWYDSRLQWNATEWGVNDTTFIVESNSKENSDIWTPDVELYNAEESFDEAFTIKAALVDSSGLVFWSRPGKVKTLCKFTGLERFPYDTLKCELELGAWTLYKAQQDIVLNEGDGGVSWVGKCRGEPGAEKCDGSASSAAGAATSETSGSRFQDYSILDITASRQETVYASTGKSYPSLVYKVYLKRSSGFYTMKLVAPQIAFNVLSWVTYFMDPQVGERLGFGITLLLAVTAQDFIAGQFMPVCDETLVMNHLSWICQAFVCFALLETGVVLCTYHLELIYLDSMLPSCLRRRCGKRLAIYEFEGESKIADLLTHHDTGSESTAYQYAASLLANHHGPDVDATAQDRQNRVKPTPEEDVKAIPSPVEESPPELDSWSLVEDFVPGAICEPEQPSPAAAAVQPRKSFEKPHKPKTVSREREALYIHVFSVLDHNCDGHLDTGEVESFLQLLIEECKRETGRGGPLERQNTLQVIEIDADKSNSISLKEFVMFCERTFERVPADVADHMLERFVEVAQTYKEKATQRWKHMAVKIDKLCRWLVPVTTIIAYFILWLSF
jgi:nicotinic acetylcholine receptor alpha-10